ncbi:hypothetical protein P261_00356 [Lachnospiraceae bacterium TWA4]|nr:hypothetical protein P261_00356 [Lachnospiraceae bacterium TWA4]
MNKILIEVKLPAADMVYDFFIPKTMQIGTMTNLVASVFSKLSKGAYLASESSVLCEQKSGLEFNSDLYVYETEIQNGTKFFLY